MAPAGPLELLEASAERIQHLETLLEAARAEHDQLILEAARDPRIERRAIADRGRVTNAHVRLLMRHRRTVAPVYAAA